MDEGNFFLEKQQILLTTLKEAFEQFSVYFSAQHLQDESDPGMVKKIQEYQRLVEQKYHELINNCQEATNLALQFEALFNHAPMAYLLMDAHRRIAAANHAAAQLLKTSPASLFSKEIDAFVAEEHLTLLISFIKNIDTLAIKQIELKMVASNRDHFFINLYCSRLKKSEDAFQYLIVLHPVDAFKQQQEILVREKMLLQQENAELEKFMYSASHDLRSPMVSIMGVINVARMETQDEQMIVYLNFIEMSVRKLDDFVQDLINLSKNSATEIRIEKIKLRELISGIFEQLQYIDNVKLIRKVIIVDDKAELHSDKERLSIILSNLLSNAIKYHHLKQEDPYIEISIIVNKLQAVISLQDNGQGIGEEHLDKIFNKFYRASQTSKGSGLGLFIVKETVEKLGGSIQVKSMLGRGTQFTMTLPNLISVK